MVFRGLDFIKTMFDPPKNERRVQGHHRVEHPKGKLQFVLFLLRFVSILKIDIKDHTLR